MTIGNAAFEEVIRPIPGLVADGNLDTAQHHFVKISGDYKVAIAASDEMPIGVLCNKPLSGCAATIAGVGSTVKLVLGDTVVAGDKLCPDSSSGGTAVPATTGDSTIAVAVIGGAVGDTIPAIIVGGLTVI